MKRVSKKAGCFNNSLFFTGSEGRPAPVTAMEMRYRVDKYAYDDIRIDLPVAVAAPVK